MLCALGALLCCLQDSAAVRGVFLTFWFFSIRYKNYSHQNIIKLASFELEQAGFRSGTYYSHLFWITTVFIHHSYIPISLSDDIPIFTEEPLSVVQKLGGSVTLRCSALPNHVNISWRLNGRELPTGGDEELGVLVRPGSLYIPSLTNLTVGRYQCVATTSVGSCASVPANVTAASEYTHAFTHISHICCIHSYTQCCELKDFLS